MLEMIRVRYFLRSFLSSTSLFLSLAYNSVSANHSEQVEILKEKVAQWIDLEQEIAKNKASWEQEEILLQDEIAILNKDNEYLRDQIAESLQFLNQSDENRTELITKRDRILKLLQAIGPQIRKLELSCIRLYAYLPEILKDNLQDKYQRIRTLENQRIRSGEIGERFLSVLSF